MPQLIEQQPGSAKSESLDANQSAKSIDKMKPGWLEQRIKHHEHWKQFAVGLDLRADLYFLRHTGRIPNAAELKTVKDAHGAEEN